MASSSSSSSPPFPSSITLAHNSSAVDCYVVCHTYSQLYAYRHLDAVNKLLSCISSYNNNHQCGTTEKAFQAHRTLILRKYGKWRHTRPRRLDEDNAHHALTIERMQRELDQCQYQLERARADRDALQVEVEECREGAIVNAEERDTLRQQLFDAVGPPSISAERPKRDRVSQPQLTTFFRFVCNKRQRS